MLEWIFAVNVFLVLYTYLGYGLILFLLKKLYPAQSLTPLEDYPAVTLLVAAYNEEDWIEQKIENCLALDYPRHKLHLLLVTDGSTDSTPQKAKSCLVPQDFSIQILHDPKRLGKLAAVNRVMPLVGTPIVVFSDANTTLNPQAIQNLVKYYSDPKVGAVAGEKRIYIADKDEASSAGEGIYWKYESLLKRWDAQLCSVVGAAGELFSIRTQLYESIPADTLIEDFYLTMTVLRKGYRIAYAADAYAIENSSASVGEELKRKIRISAGGLQASWRLRDLLNPLRYGIFSWQFFSHKVMRWTLAPLALLLAFLSNAALVWTGSILYVLLFMFQLVFYLLAFLGWIFERKKIKVKVLFIPYYFCMMNYSVFLGLLRLIKGKQTVLWEKVERKGNQ
ncbi:glycosyltransferase family 2 protein [Haliscomenobacter hydrossis]|uniref:Glycosyl transferase family 2 n=1 Tax=Haliscomenobacter hydrossis (strain ATCC 27775 / DSM 1100 / LMG 10767 / O) TaxID=760192 RepID=F4L1M3_HALH1|nr:glycosyltransferase family 2 protein [Haliscomenobacter hydrossis]AEE48567.1 glycosyl transferase family 2 [Haliscomenobacter hydrossis DSM 1100]